MSLTLQTFVLRPPPLHDSPSEPKAVIHFTGGAFVGASPQLTYRHLLEGLASRGFVIVATPFETNFEHLRITDDVHVKYTRGMAALGPRVAGLKVFGLGHSLGALLQLLLCSRYGCEREGNVLISFNNKPVTDAIPFYSELISPATSGLAPVLSALANSPQAKILDALGEQLRAGTSDEVRQLFPLIDQLQPIFEDISNDRLEFSPTPEESRRMVQRRYGVSRNLLVRFLDDNIDETPDLSLTLQGLSQGQPGAVPGTAGNMDLSVRTLPGDHATPCQQPLPEEIPSQIAAVASQGSDIFGVIAGISELASSATGLPESPITGIAKNVQKGFESVNDNLQGSTEASVEQVEALEQEIVLWSGIEPRVVPQLPGGPSS